MDIAFICEKCGQNIVIDEAGAGITVDCPRCGKPVYVPSSVPTAGRSAPARIEASSARPIQTERSGMKLKTRKLLITGVALLVFGPVLGYVLWFVGLFYAMQTPASMMSPGGFPDIGRMLSTMSTRMFASLLPLLLGTLAGATGFFLIVYSLISHFVRTER